MTPQDLLVQATEKLNGTFNEKLVMWSKDEKDPPEVKVLFEWTGEDPFAVVFIDLQTDANGEVQVEYERIDGDDKAGLSALNEGQVEKMQDFINLLICRVVVEAERKEGESNDSNLEV